MSKINCIKCEKHIYKKVRIFNVILMEKIVFQLIVQYVIVRKINL